MRRRSLLLPTLLLVVTPASFTGATTIVPAADPGELAVESHAVFLARAGASRLIEREGYLATATELEVLSVIKGRLEPGDTVESIAPGGVRPNGSGWLVAGSPSLEEGEVYLFFADRDSRGRWQPRLMADSVLREELDADGFRVLVPLEEASHLNRIGAKGLSSPLVPGPVYEDLFLDELYRTLADGTGWSWAAMMADIDAGDAALKSVPSGCSFMNSGGTNVRWNRWDSGGTALVIRADDDGDDVLGSGGFTAVSGAVNRWNTAPDPTSILLSYGGTTNVGTSWCDALHSESMTNWDTPPSSSNVVVFGDPCDDIPNLSGCSGTLAFGGPWFGATHTFDGTTWYTATSLFVVINNGAGCLGATNYERMLTHEIGHGLGFGHVSDSSALMYSNCCHDHNQTDITCAQYAYPPAGPSPTATNTPTPTPTPTGPTATPTNTPTPTVTPTATWTPGGPIATPTPTSTPTPTMGGPTSTPTRTPTPTSGSSEPSGVTVPVVVHTEGVGGTPWRSDVTVTNRNGAAQTLRLTYRTASNESFGFTRTLPGFSTLLLEDVVADVFNAGDGRGPLDVDVVHGGSTAPAVVSRAYAEGATGNLGSGLPADVAFSTNVVSMTGLFHDDAFRTNIAVTAGDEETWATFELFRGNTGLVAGGVMRKVDADEQNQWSIQKLFGNLARQGVPMTVRVTLSNPGIVYASIVDNNSTDSAVLLGTMPAYGWIVPVVAHLPGSGGTFWSSSVSMWNTTGNTAWVDLEYLPEKTDNSGGGLVAASIKLDPYESRTLGDVLLDRYGIDNGKGVLLVTGTRPITVSSRVYTDCETCPDGGTSGNGVRTVRSTALTSGTTVLPGVRERDGFRTNVGVVTGDQGVTFTFDLRDEDGTLRASASKSLAPRTLQQWSMNKLFGNGFVVPNPAGSIVVTASRPYLAYMTVIDGSSQDPVFVMPQ